MRSLDNMAHFKRQIDTIHNPASERFVRIFLSELADDCPREVLEAMALAVYVFRNTELSEIGESN